MPQDRAFGERYLEWTLQIWKEIEASLRRTITLIVVLVLVFLALVDAKQTELLLGPIKLSNNALILPLIPALVSFLYYEFMVLSFERRRYMVRTTTLLGEMHHRVAENLAPMLSPATTSIWGDHLPQQLRSSERNRLTRLLEGSGMLIIVMLLLGAIAFLGYAYMRLLGHAHMHLGLVIASLAFSSFNVLRAVFTFIDDGHAGH